MLVSQGAEPQSLTRGSGSLSELFCHIKSAPGTPSTEEGQPYGLEQTLPENPGAKSKGEGWKGRKAQLWLLRAS